METQTVTEEPVSRCDTAVEELVDAVRRDRRKLRARGLFGAARGFALKRVVDMSKRPLVCIEPDEEAAEALEKDLRFFGLDVARLPADEVLPYEGISPDRMVAQQRLASLFRLHLGTGAQVIVSSVRGLGRGGG